MIRGGGSASAEACGVVVEGGRIVGAQGMRATAFRKDRTVVTGSWLPAAAGRGLSPALRPHPFRAARYSVGEHS